MIPIQTVFASQQAFFKSGETIPSKYRIQQLKKLEALIQSNEQNIYDALAADFNKPAFETFVSEIGVTLLEIQNAVNHLDDWSTPTPVSGNLLLFPSLSKIKPRPKGTVCVIAPWNYPLNLSLIPAVAAIAAGNTVLLKPSEEAPHTSQLLADIINAHFSSSFFYVIQGGVEASQELLALPFDHIFFTGSTKVGKIVMKAAAEHLAPVTLELGGKNPCIVDSSAKLAQAAKRIVWGKFLNAGQTCIAPDFLLVDEAICEAFLALLTKEIARQYGSNIENNPDFARVINSKHFERLNTYLSQAEILFGGIVNAEKNYISPTIIRAKNLEQDVMNDEIFGPILPIVTYSNLDEAIEIAQRHPNPLSLYIFSKSKSVRKKLIQNIPAGGVCINDVIEHYANKELPFGGVRSSGIGAYHGKHGFDTFSHQQAIYSKATWIDVPLKFAPFGKKLGLVKSAFRITKWLR